MVSPVTVMFKTTLLIIVSFHFSGALSHMAPRGPVQVYERATSQIVPTSTTKFSNHSTTATSTSTSTRVPSPGVYKKILINFDDLNAPVPPPQVYNYLSFHPSLLVIRNHSSPYSSPPNVLYMPRNGTALFRSVSPCGLFDILSLRITAHVGARADVSIRSQRFATFTGTKYDGQKVRYDTAVRDSVFGEVALGSARGMVDLVEFRVNGTSAMAFDDILLGRYEGRVLSP